MSTTLKLVFGSLLLWGANGCSMGYQQNWKQAAALAPSEATLVGRWEGRWLSRKNGHTGRLRCIVHQTGADEYEFHYWARFWTFFSTTYKITIVAKASEGEIHFDGSQNLGRLYGGVYTHEGSVKNGTLTATYRCKIDHGDFSMRKLEGGP